MTARSALRLLLVVPAFLGIAVAGVSPSGCFAGEWRNSRPVYVSNPTRGANEPGQNATPTPVSKVVELRWLPPDRGTPSSGPADDREVNKAFSPEEGRSHLAKDPMDSGTQTDRALAVVLEVPVIGDAEPTDDPLADPFGDRQSSQSAKTPANVAGQVAQVQPPRPLQTPAELIPPPCRQEVISRNRAPRIRPRVVAKRDERPPLPRRRVSSWRPCLRDRPISVRWKNSLRRCRAWAKTNVRRPIGFGKSRRSPTILPLNRESSPSNVHFRAVSLWRETGSRSFSPGRPLPCATNPCTLSRWPWNATAITWDRSSSPSRQRRTSS